MKGSAGFLLITLLGLLVSSVSGWVVLRASREDLAFQATVKTLLAAQRFVHIERRFPRSWEELESTQFELTEGCREWVVVDWEDLTCEKIPRLAEDFDAIRPLVRCSEIYHEQAQAFLNTVSELCHPHLEPPRPVNFPQQMPRGRGRGRWRHFRGRLVELHPASGGESIKVRLIDSVS